MISSIHRLMAKLALNSPELKSIEQEVKNRFKWSCLLETVQVEGNTFSLNCFSKIREPGKAICNHPINYGTSGKIALRKHMMHPKHVKLWKIQQQNMHIEIARADNIVAAPHNNSAQPRSIPPLCKCVAQDQVSVF